MDKNRPSSESAPQPAPVVKQRSSNLWVQALGYTLAVGAGIATIAVNIRDIFYDTSSHWPGFKELKDKRNKRINKVIRGVFDDSKPLDGEAFYKATRVHHDLHNTKRKELLAKIDIGTEKGPLGFIKDTYKSWQHLGEGKRGAILFSGAVSTGLTIGSFFLLNQNAVLRGKLNNIQNTIDSER